MKKTMKCIKKNIFSIFTISVCAIVMLSLLFSPEGLKGMMHVFKEIQVNWLLFAFLAVLASWIMEGICIHIFCKDIMKDWSFVDSFQIGMIGSFYNGITPFASGGQPMQIYFLSKKGMDAGFATSIIAKRSIVYQAILVTYAIVMMCFSLNFFMHNISNFAWLAVFGVISNGSFILFILLFSLNEKLTKKVIKSSLCFFAKIHLIKNYEKKYLKIETKLNNFHDGISSCNNALKTYTLSVIFTAIQITFCCIIPYFIYRSFHFDTASILNILSADSFVTMVSAFIPLPGSSGGAEGSFYLFFNLFFENGTILPAIVLWRFLTYYCNILVGGIISAIKPKNHRRKNTNMQINHKCKIKIAS